MTKIVRNIQLKLESVKKIKQYEEVVLFFFARLELDAICQRLRRRR